MAKRRKKPAQPSPYPVPNLVDRAVGIFSAKKLAQRMFHRKQAMALTGGYHGGGNMRKAMRNWTPDAGSPEVDQGLDLKDLRSRTRDLSRNAPAAAAAVNINVTSVIGTGLTMRPRIHRDVLKLSDAEAEAWEDATRRRFDVWANSELCDAEMTNNFYEMQGVAFRSMLDSGDSLALMPRIDRSGWPFKLAVQLIEADRLSNPGYKMDTATQIGGIDIGKYGEPVTYNFSDKHPGALYRTGLKWTAVPAFGAKTGRRNVLHLFEQLRPNQKRGVPFLAPVIEQLKQLGRYTDNELESAVINGALSVFIKMDPDAFQDLFDDPDQSAYLSSSMQWDGTLGSGKAVNLLPGEEVSSESPGRPNPQFDPFVMAVLRQIGMALEIPYEVLILHFQSSYSAARAALLSAWRVFRKRREFMASKFCQPVYETWLAEEVAAGNISAPGFFSDAIVRAAYCGTKWTGDAPGSIDPEKEAKAAQARYDLGITTLDDESIAFDGEEYESKHKQQVKERGMRIRDGLPVAPGGSTAALMEPDNDEGAASPDGVDAPPAEPDADEPDALEAAAENSDIPAGGNGK